MSAIVDHLPGAKAGLVISGLAAQAVVRESGEWKFHSFQMVKSVD